MTEDSGELHPDSEKASMENNKKRRLKTPAQVVALENFYDEHKYPTEEMKAKVAEEIGLTEKQVSGWFCHRRLKDKRSVRDEGNITVRPDRSSVVIQDRGSGLRQDSCGSTKQNDYKNLDAREAESQRLFRNQYMGNVDGADSTSSESSSSLQDMRVSRKEDVGSRYFAPNGGFMPLDHQVTSNMGYKPSGYLKVKGETENVAITAVKRQLGKHYQLDGPPLGVEFDPLPPGAFESQTNDIVHEPIYVGNQRRPHSSVISGHGRQYDLGCRSEAHSLKTRSPDPRLGDEDDNKPIVGARFKNRNNNKQSSQRSSHLNYSDAFPDQNALRDMYEDSCPETPALNSTSDKMSSKAGAVGMAYGSIPGSRDPCGTDFEISHPLHDYDHFGSKYRRKSEYIPKSSKPAVGRIKSPYAEQRGPSIGMVSKFYGEKNLAKAGREKLFAEEPTIAKQVRHDYSPQDYAAKVSSVEMLGQKNQLKRSAVEVPSSFSEEETAETSSSMD